MALVSILQFFLFLFLNSVAPLRAKNGKTKSDPWLNQDTTNLRRACRRAEHRWKRDKLQVSYKILLDTLVTYQNAVKTAKMNYFGRLILRYNGNSKGLFYTSVLY